VNNVRVLSGSSLKMKEHPMHLHFWHGPVAPVLPITNAFDESRRMARNISFTQTPQDQPHHLAIPCHTRLVYSFGSKS